MDRIASVLDTVVTRTELYAQLAALRDESGHPHLSPRDCEVVARYLERDMRVLVVDGEVRRSSHTDCQTAAPRRCAYHW